MSTDIGDIDEDEEEPVDAHLRATVTEELRKRATDAKIPFETRQADEDETYVTLQLPLGREKRPVTLWSLERIQQVLAVPFEQFTFLGPYEAICSYRDGTIEASVRALGTVNSPYLFWRRVRGVDIGEESHEPLIMKMDGSPTDLTVSLGLPTESLLALTRGPRRGLALRLTGARITQHDSALAFLERIANAVFFQIDVRFKVPLSLLRARLTPRRVRQSSGAQTVAELPFPQSEYDSEPMSLYWYGRSAAGMPLLQYLAFYQVLEFYFPTYAQREAHKRVKNILRNPGFDAHSDTDISRVLNTMRGLGGRADERSQLRATIQNCINSRELLAFFHADEQRKEFLSKGKSLKAHRIPIESKEADLSVDVAQRIYDIRCMIVHTKNSDDDEDLSLLLPFSKEAESLDYDIELLQFIAREVLVASSKPMRATDLLSTN